jgi:hypothetical protein
MQLRDSGRPPLPNPLLQKEEKKIPLLKAHLAEASLLMRTDKSCVDHPVVISDLILSRQFIDDDSRKKRKRQICKGNVQSYFAAAA